MQKRLKNILRIIFILLIVYAGYTGWIAPSKKAEQPAAGQKTEQTSKETAEQTSEDRTSEDRTSEDRTSEDKSSEDKTEAAGQTTVDEDGEYTSMEEVAAYLQAYDHLPSNFITKSEAKKLGWVSSKGNLADVAPGKSIGGDHYGNYEELLPDKKGREYHECDIDSDGGYRGAKRIIYSNDGLIYYTDDHYESFELIAGEE